MTRNEFMELKNKFSTISEAIMLYDSGNHSEYNKDDLDKQLDDIHKVLCIATSDLAQEIIKAIDEGNAYDSQDVEYLNALFLYCDKCRCYNEGPEMYDLKNSYGNGVIDGIGADFTVYYNDRTEYKYFGYSEFGDLLETYGIFNY